MTHEPPKLPDIPNRPSDASSHRSLIMGAFGILALLSVAPLLAWTFGLGSFSSWFLYVTAPAWITLLAAGLLTKSRLPKLRTALIAGALGGLLGTFAYDIFRIPFAAIGFRLFSPIESYGVLLLSAQGSSGWTDLAGWTFHFFNGMAFGVAYAAVALDRHWGWAIAWAMVLETATVVTPFADAYALRGRWGVIAIAYAAHLPYGLALGYVVSRGTSFVRQATERFTRPASLALAVLAIFLLVWHRPFLVDPQGAEGRAIAPGASALIADGKFAPEWVRVTGRGCATFVNTDPITYRMIVDSAVADIKAGESRSLCFEGFGVKRVTLSIEPFSGGFVIIDE